MSLPLIRISVCIALLGGLGGTGCRPSAETLLREGRLDEVLARVRPVGAKAMRVRAEALRRQGKLEAARVEAGIALGLDEYSADAHRLMGIIESELGAPGAALSHLARSLDLDWHQPGVKAAVARLLLQRALLRADPAVGELDEARRDMNRVGELDPRLSAEGKKALEAASRADPRPASRPQSRSVSSLPQGRSASWQCPGIPPALESAGLPKPGDCRLPAASLIAENQRRNLVAACHGASLALRLESQGCVRQAQEMWSLLEEEAPNDPRWPFQQGRVLLAQGMVDTADLRFTDAVYLSGDRSAAQLRVAEVLLLAARPRDAGARAVQAIALASRLEQQLQAVRLLRRCGLPEAVRDAEAAILARGWGLSRAELQTRLAEGVTKAR